MKNSDLKFLEKILKALANKRKLAILKYLKLHKEASVGERDLRRDQSVNEGHVKAFDHIVRSRYSRKRSKKPPSVLLYIK